MLDRGRGALRSPEATSRRLRFMGSRLVKRRLEDVQRQLAQARESLAVLEEQVAVWNDALDDARIRALVSETPAPVQGVRRTLAPRHGRQRRDEAPGAWRCASLLAPRDELLREWTPKDDHG